MWEKIATNIRKVASEVRGVTKGSGGEAKDTWWWNEKVQRTIKGVFGTAPQTLLHKLHRGAGPQKTGVCGVPL